VARWLARHHFSGGGVAGDQLSTGPKPKLTGNGREMTGRLMKRRSLLQCEKHAAIGGNIYWRPLSGWH